MSQILSDVGRKLSRIFLGRIIVRGVGELRRVKGAKIETHFRRVNVYPIRVEPRVSAARFAEWNSSKAKAAGPVLGGHKAAELKVVPVRLAISKRPRATRVKLNIKARAVAKRAMRDMEKIPSVRHNRVNFLKRPPKIERATLLALYSPLYQEKVLKSALDKSSGNLLFWYDNKRVKSGDKYHLLLLRVFGGAEPLKWVWLPADKKIG